MADNSNNFSNKPPGQLVANREAPSAISLFSCCWNLISAYSVAKFLICKVLILKEWKEASLYNVGTYFSSKVKVAKGTVYWDKNLLWKQLLHLYAQNTSNSVFIGVSIKFLQIINSYLKRKWQKFIQKFYKWKVQEEILFFYLYFTWLCGSWMLQRVLEK